jgi:uncharacterized membrane protein YraQ (UPF0718 family)
MNTILNLTAETILNVWHTLSVNWPYLLASAVIAALLKLYVNQDQVSAFLRRYSRVGVAAATTAAVATPLCSCGTTAVLLGMMASLMPWGPIVAFMVASPLTSPQGLVYSAGLFGWPFALAFFIASILLGLLGGAAASLLERRGWLENQTRFSAPGGSLAAVIAQTPAQQVDSGSILPRSAPSAAFAPGFAAAACCPGDLLIPLEAVVEAPACQTCAPAPTCQSCSPAPASTSDRRKPSLHDLVGETANTCLRLLAMFLGFAFIGYFLNGLIPDQWVAAIFGKGNLFSVPLAATLGLPLYFNSEASLPMVLALLEAGMSPGAAMAFMIAGAGTSIGAIAGALTIARWRVVGLVIGVLWSGAILTGLTYNLMVAAGLF